MTSRLVPVFAAIVAVALMAGSAPAQRQDPIQLLQKDVLDLQGYVKDLQGIVKDLHRSSDTRSQNLQTLLERVVDRVNLMPGEIQAGVQTSVQTSAESVIQSNRAGNDRLVKMLEDIKAQNDKSNQDVSASLVAMNADMNKLNDRLVEKITAALTDRFNDQNKSLQQTISGMQLQIDAMNRQIAKINEAPTTAPLPSPDQLLREAFSDMSMGATDLAIEGFDGIIAKYPDHPAATRALVLKGKAYYDTANWAKANETYTSVLQKQVDGDTKRTALYKKALSLANLKQNKEAVAVFDQIVDEFPDTPEAVNSAEQSKRLKAPAPAGRGAGTPQRGG